MSSCMKSDDKLGSDQATLVAADCPEAKSEGYGVQDRDGGTV